MATIDLRPVDTSTFVDGGPMSVPVPIDRLRAEMARFGAAFLLTVTDDARPHAVAVAPSWSGDALVVSAGKTSRRNAAARPDVTVLWPGPDPGEFSLIVDAAATVDDGAETVTLTASRAVLHRPAAGGGSDCVDLSKNRYGGPLHGEEADDVREAAAGARQAAEADGQARPPHQP